MLVTVQKLMGERAFVRSVAVRVDDFTYNDAHELEAWNVWTIRERGLLIVCAKGLRPADDRAVRLGTGMGHANLGSELTHTAHVAEQLGLPKGVALVLEAMTEEWSPDEALNHKIISLSGVDLRFFPLEQESLVDLCLFSPVESIAVAAERYERESAEERRRKKEKLAETRTAAEAKRQASSRFMCPGPFSEELTVESITGRSDMLEPIMDDPSRVVVLMGPAARSLYDLAAQHVGASDWMLPLGVTEDMVDVDVYRSMGRLAEVIQRAKVGQVYVLLSSEAALVPLVAELFNVGVTCAVYMVVLGHGVVMTPVVQLGKLVISDEQARTWLDKVSAACDADYESRKE